MRVIVSFTVTYAGSYYTYFELYDDYGDRVDTAYGSTFSMSDGGSKSGLNKTFYGLDPGTSYYIVASLWNASTDTRLSISEPTVYFTTESAFEPPTIYINSAPATSDGVTVNCYVDVPAGGTHYVVFKVSYLGTSQSNESYSFTSSRSLSWTFSGIPSRTSVSVRVEVRDYSTDELYDYATTTVTTSAPPRPSNWSWSSTVSRGSAMPYTRSGNVVTCKPLTAAEWNGFVDRVIEFREYLGLSAGNLSALYVTKGTSFDADVFDAMRQVIAAMNPPTSVPSAIAAGGRITAAFVNGLKNSLNSIQ